MRDYNIEQVSFLLKFKVVSNRFFLCQAFEHKGLLYLQLQKQNMVLRIFKKCTKKIKSIHLKSINFMLNFSQWDVQKRSLFYLLLQTFFQEVSPWKWDSIKGLCKKLRGRGGKKSKFGFLNASRAAVSEKYFDFLVSRSAFVWDRLNNFNGIISKEHSRIEGSTVPLPNEENFFFFFFLSGESCIRSRPNVCYCRIPYSHPRYLFPTGLNTTDIAYFFLHFNVPAIRSQVKKKI